MTGLLCAMLFAQNSPPQSSAEDPWQSLRFLIGTWRGATKGGSAGGRGAGDYTFDFELRNHVLARHGAYSECSGPADFDCGHGDLLYIYPESAKHALQAIYFDNEGHVIHYEVTIPVRNTAIFLSTLAEPGPQYRLTYELRAEVMTGRFEVRTPGDKEFKTYLEWSGKKK